ncbi:MAG: methyl-accepting chemotaxis protein [Treponema sp.]|nr:methyl-accepting chemotaxis protein [Treponema sp.]
MNFKKSVEQEKGILGVVSIWVGALICATLPMLGGILHGGFSISGIALSVIIGYGIVGVYMCLSGMQSSDTALSIHDAANAAMGTIAAQIITSLPIAVACIGWFGIQAATLGDGFSSAWKSLTGMTIPPAVSTLIWGTITMIIAIYGFKWIKHFSYVTLPILIGILIYVVYTLCKNGGFSKIMAYRPAQSMSLLVGVNLAVSSIALMGVIAGDYFRHTKTRLQVIVTCGSAVIPAACIMFCIGAAGVIITGQSDISTLLTQWGHPILGIFFLIFATIGINIVNAYSGGLGVLKMLGFDQSKFKLTTGIACTIGMLLGASGILSLFASFLTLVSSSIPPIAGVVIGAYWIQGKGNTAQFFQTPQADVRFPGIIAFIMGALTIYATTSIIPFFIPAINGMIVSLLSYCIMASCIPSTIANRNLSLGTKLTGGFIACAIITLAAGGLGLHGLTSLTTAENAAQSRDITSMTVIIMVSGVALSFGMGIMFTGLVVKPMRSAFELLKNIAQGDLTQEISSSSNDEIGQMMRLLKETQQGISSLIASVNSKAQSLDTVGNELSAMMDQSASAVYQISANTQNMNQKALTQAAGVSQTNAIMGKIVLNINAINQHIETQLNSVSKSAAAIEQMTAHINSITHTLLHNRQNVQDLAYASEQGKVRLQAVSKNIAEVAEESAHLLEINAVIKNIASQTNFLSMNAAIEAAHAGTSGLGFAVVAEEIHRLAESSAKQVTIISRALKHITESIEQIHGASGQVIHHFEDIDTRVNTVVSQEQDMLLVMEQQDAGCKQILSMIRDSKNLSEQVHSQSEEMLIGSKEVITEGKNLETLTADLTNGINEIASGMNQINTAVSRVSEIASENKGSIAVLLQSLARFKYSA